jgi:hypothetical protein
MALFVNVSTDEDVNHGRPLSNNQDYNAAQK